MLNVNTCAIEIISNNRIFNRAELSNTIVCLNMNEKQGEMWIYIGQIRLSILKYVTHLLSIDSY